MSNADSSVTEDQVGAELDNEIATLRSQIASLKTQRKLQATTLISSRVSKHILSRLKTHPPPPNQASHTIPEDSPLHSLATAQATHNQENVYRACASITTFRIQDPDPNAVDGGHVLGIRIDVSGSVKFARPYYVMLNKPWTGSQSLRVHRHTVPPCIPLASLAERHIPAPSISGDIVKSKPQNLRSFVRALRKEVVGYHNRVSAIKAMRKSFNLDEVVEERKRRKGKTRAKVIADISAADAEAKQVRIEWVDGRIGRAIVGEKGEVLKCVVVGEEGRDFGMERRIVGEGGLGRMEGIADRLLEGIY